MTELIHGEGCAITIVWRAMPLPEAAVFADSEDPVEALGECTCHLTSLLVATEALKKLWCASVPHYCKEWRRFDPDSWCTRCTALRELGIET
jgi:hypothetical protein